MPAFRRPSLAQILPALIGGIVATILYLLAYRAHPAHPHLGGGIGWFAGFDQGRYLRAAIAWSHGDLRAGEHWYMPGYPFLAAPLTGWLSLHAYAVVDLVCLLASLLLFSELSVRLLPAPPLLGRSLGRSLGAAVFIATTLCWTRESDIWVVPWSTTATTPLIFGTLLATTIFLSGRAAAAMFAAAFCATLVVAFRPTDLLPTVAGPAIVLSAVLLAGRRLAPILRAGAAAVAGAACAGALTAALYVPVFGWQASTYLRDSSRVGLDAGLILPHWVGLFVDPKPLFADGDGLVAVFPWIATGLCGLVAATLLARPRATRLSHAAILLTAILYTLIYLAYRDLNAPGLWRYQNYHYFKWLLPVLGLYTCLLAWQLLAHRRLATLACAMAVAAVTLPWRLEPAAPTPLRASYGADNDIAFDADLDAVTRSVLVAADGRWDDMYYGASTLRGPRGPFIPIADFRLTPRFDGFMLTLMRPAGDGAMTLHVPPAVTLAGTPPIAIRQHIAFGVPCWLSACPARPILPPPTLRPGTPIVFDGHQNPYLQAGWSAQEAGGQWTDGDRATLSFTAHGRLSLRFDASPFVPAGSPPLHVAVFVDQTQVADRMLSSMAPVILATTPVEIDGPAQVTIRLNARRPADFDPHSTDRRRVGLYMRRLDIAAAP